MIIQAATDTTSSALNRVVHLLALHPDVQEKLRAEITQTKDEMDHDELVGLPYLDSFIRETLRLFVSFQCSSLPLIVLASGSGFWPIGIRQFPQ